MRTYPFLIASMVFLFITGCQGEQNIQLSGGDEASLEYPQQSGEENQGDYVSGELVYVPVYSSVFNEASEHYPLTATLNIHNIDLDNPITLVKVDYYNTDGELIRKYIHDHVEIRSLQTMQFVVEEYDTSGGTGANFVVEWVSQTQASSPIIEALMISTSSQQGVSFITEGKIIRTLGSDN